MNQQVLGSVCVCVCVRRERASLPHQPRKHAGAHEQEEEAHARSDDVADERVVGWLTSGSDARSLVSRSLLLCLSHLHLSHPIHHD